MSIFSRFFGKRELDDAPVELVAGPKKDDSPALQVLFADSFRLDPLAVAATMRAYHSSMDQARYEVAEELNQRGNIFGLAGWGDHVIKVVGFDVPMPKDVVELCVAPSHYGQPLKDRARAHKSHVLLWHAGREESVVEQFVALAAFAGVLEHFGAIIALNESARTSFPAAALSSNGIEGDMMEQLRTLPLPALYCGFVKFNIPNDKHVWMRTYGAYVLGLPDLAAHTNGHHEGQRYFDMFNSIMRYMLNTGNRVAAGHTMQVGADDYMRCRAPTEDETWLESKGEMLVAEVIRGDQINQ
jgi:hypothetical protein